MGWATVGGDTVYIPDGYLATTGQNGQTMINWGNQNQQQAGFNDGTLKPSMSALIQQNGGTGGGGSDVQNTGSSGTGGGGGGGTDQVSGVFNDVNMVFQDMFGVNSQFQQGTANAESQKNAREQIRLNRATTASNLRTQAQNSYQSAMSFQDQYDTKQKKAAFSNAFIAGMAKGMKQWGQNQNRPAANPPVQTQTPALTTAPQG